MDRLNLGAASNDPDLDCERAAQGLRSSLSDLLDGPADQPTPHDRLARIVRTIECDIIPRLVQAHRGTTQAVAASRAAASPPAAAPARADVAAFARLLLSEDEAPSHAVIDAHLARGEPLDDLCLNLLAPAARELGRLWDDDRCSFSDVTVGMGRLQRLMRMIGPLLGESVHLPPDCRRVLLVPAPGETHTFGVVIVAEFFRRAGWDVVSQSDGQADPLSLVRAEWFDVVGVSVGTHARLDWLRQSVAALRQASRNRAIAVMAGGPLFLHDNPGVTDLGVDAATADARIAPVLAAQLVDARAEAAPLRRASTAV